MRLELHPCKVGTTLEARCGTFEVFEDRTTRTGRKININVVVVPSTSAHPNADPLFFFSGGPGQAATSAAGAAGFGFFARIRKERDLVFIDQRGTGHSNPLNCDRFDDVKNLRAYFGELYPLDKIRECREKLEKIADLKLYTTSIAEDDVDEIREALGYDKINILGESYGTQAAQVYLRQHPDHVRAVLLEGVARLDTKIPLQFARGAQEALDRLFEDCAADHDCRSAFPNLKQEFAEILSRFKNGALSFEMTNPATEQKEPVRMLRGNFAVRLLSLLYSPASAARVPFLIHRAFQNDYEPFALAAIRANTGGSIARGMYLSVTCAESIPFITERDIEKASKGTFVGDYRTRSHIAGCREWPRASVSPKFLDPIDSAVPVLMISGTIDPATPYWLGQSAVKHLPNGRQVLVNNTGHAFGHPCLQSIAAEFIERGSAKEINASCTDNIKRPRFLTDAPM